jgi:hypothetical protein
MWLACSPGLSKRSTWSSAPTQLSPVRRFKVRVCSALVPAWCSKAARLTVPAQVVEARGVILEKPDDAQHAASMLKSLSGTQHLVYTGVVLLLPRVPGARAGAARRMLAGDGCNMCRCGLCRLGAHMRGARGIAVPGMAAAPHSQHSQQRRPRAASSPASAPLLPSPRSASASRVHVWYWIGEMPGTWRVLHVRVRAWGRGSFRP